MALHQSIAWCGGTHHVGSQECGYNRYCHYHRIKEIADDAKRQAERGYDKCELTNLGHRKSAFHGCLERLSAKQIAERTEHGLTYQYSQDNRNHRHGIFNKNLRLYKHADRNEEDCSEQILDRLNELDDFVCLNRLCQYTAHDKCAESTAETDLRGNHRHQATQSERYDKQRLIVNQLAHIAQHHRYKEYADNEP